MNEAIRIAQENCAREPIHLLGRIQSHGFLLAIDLATLTITHASTNVSDFFGGTAEDWIGRRIEEMLLRTNAGVDGADESFLVRRPEDPATFLCRAHRNSQGAWIWEVEAYAAPAETSWFEESRAAQKAFTRLRLSVDLTELADAMAEEVQNITGFDHVMIYRYDPEWNGEVVAEKLVRGDAYLGQRFPASDIPPQARALFIANWLRAIVDIDATPAKMVPSTPLELTRSQLRHPSLIHLEYLRNMGVRSSLTLSLLHEGKLWGLVACHHLEPRRITPAQFETCQSLAQLASALLEVKQESDDVAYRASLAEVHDKLVEYMRESDDTSIGLVRYKPNLLDLAQARGAAAAIYLEGRWAVIGKIPTLDQITGILYWLGHEHRGKEWFATDRLPALYPPAEAFKSVASGMLAIAIPKTESSYVLWFRPEVLQTLNWAGNPEKPVEGEGSEAKIHPRTSFELWKQEVVGRSTAWKRAEIEAALQLRKSIIETDLERQFRREKQARAETELEKKRFSFLSEVSAAFSKTLDGIEVIERLGSASILGPAEWAVVRLQDENGTWRDHPFHRTPPGLRMLRDAYPLLAFHGATGDALTRGESVLRSRVKDDWLTQWIPNEAEREHFRQRLDLRSYLAVPLFRGGHEVVGSLEWGISETYRAFTEKDLELAQQLAIRASSAYENARLFRAAERAARAREEVVGVVSHDLKNPLTAISVHAQMIERGVRTGVTEHVIEAAQKIGSLVTRMRRLTDDLLSLSKIDGGRIGLEIQSYPAEKILAEACDLFVPLAREKEISVEVIGADVTGSLRCDPERILQVLSNLGGNAVKFTPAGGQVAFELRRLPDAFEFSVRDSGPGITADELPHVFDRFWQAQRTARQGTGLGLAIAKGIVDAHGGHIFAESTLGQGTRVAFTIPTPAS